MDTQRGNKRRGPRKCVETLTASGVGVLHEVVSCFYGSKKRVEAESNSTLVHLLLKKRLLLLNSLVIFARLQIPPFFPEILCFGYLC